MIINYLFKIAVLSSVLGFINLTSNNPSNGNVNISFKKLESPIASIDTVHKELNNAGYCNQKNSTDSSIHNQKEYCNKKLEKDVSVRKSLVNTTHLLMTDTSFDSPATIKASMSPYFRFANFSLFFYYVSIFGFINRYFFFF